MSEKTEETKQMTPTPMTSRDRAELGKLLRMRAKVAKSAISQQQAVLIADVEQQLSAQYKFSDDLWADVTEAARAAVEKADAEIAKKCKAAGIAVKLRPSIGINWSGRGENALAVRRAELRMAARTRIEELAQEAKVTIDRVLTEKMETLVAGGLDSDAARAFLASMPTIDELMPRIKIEKFTHATQLNTRYRYDLDRWEPGREQKELAD
jgi:hypothetical protein